MKGSNIINQNTKSGNSVNYNDLPLEKLEEYTVLLLDYQLQCEKEGKFIEAELSRQRIIQLNAIMNKKRFKEAKVKQVKDRDDLEHIQRIELRELNEKMDRQFEELSMKFEEMQKQLEAAHDEECCLFEKEYNERQSKYIEKPSSDLIDLNKQLELYVKKKDYPNAHVVQVEIAELTKKEAELSRMEKERKFEKEIENLRQKQLLETKALDLRITNNFNKAKRDRAIAVEELLLKYKNKLRDLENYHKSENVVFEKIIKGEQVKPKTVRNTNTSMNASRLNTTKK